MFPRTNLYHQLAFKPNMKILKNYGAGKILIAFIVFIVLNSSILQAATYYFSSSMGSDNYTSVQAKNQATPWQTINKLNAIMSTLLPGDSVLFKSGDSFPGSITIGVSGTAGHPITFGAYGSGTSKPVLDNRLSLTGWVSLGGNIWESTSSDLNGQPTALMIDDVLKPLGRYPNGDAPNKGYLTVTSHPTGSKTVFTDNTLPATTDWTGAEAVVRSSHWSINRVPVKSFSNQTITLGSNTSYEIVDKFGYFFQNHPATLDQDGEWCYLTTGKKIRLYSATDPNLKVIKVANTDKYIDINTRSYLVIDGFLMRGAKRCAINLFKVKYCTIKNCDILASGVNAMNINPATNECDSISVVNNNFNQSQSNCIAATGNRLAIKGNTIKNTGMIPGMAESWEPLGMYVGGNGITIEKNTIDSTGYIPILFGGNDVLIKENCINYYCTVTDDGGAIYTQSGPIPTETNRKIINNIILNGIGAPEGANSTIGYAEGIYMDDRSPNVEISGNSVAYCTNSGIFLHNAQKMNVKNNTVFSCGAAIRMQHDNIAPTFPIINNDIQNNILCSNNLKPEGALLSYSTLDELDLSKLGVLDNNIYCQPFLKNDYIKYRIVPTSQSISNLAGWQTFSGYDMHSVTSPRSFNLFSKILSDNGVYNSKFESNIADWSTWNPEFNTSSISRETGQLDGGCLAFKVTGTGTENSSRISTSISSISAGKSYLLKLSTKSTVAGNINCTISSTNFTVKTSTTRLDEEILFTANATQGSPLLHIYSGPEDGTVYIDNVEFYKVETLNPSDFIRFEYNTTAVASTITADKNYITPAGVSYSSGSTISIPAFGSIVLLKADIVSGIGQDVRAENKLFKLYPNPAYDMTYIVGEFGSLPTEATLYDLSGRVIRQEIVTSGSPIDIGSLLKGTYLVRILGNKQTQTLKLIKR